MIVPVSSSPIFERQPVASGRPLNIGSLRRHATGLLRRVEAFSHAQGGSISASMLARSIDIYLRSTASKAVALTRAEPSLATDGRVLKRAERLNVFAPFTEPVPWRFHPRKIGPPRCIVSAPAELKAIHLLASDLVCAQIDPGPHIYHWRGRGRDQLARALGRLIENNGHYVLLADVRQCFASVNVDAIVALNLLPPELIRNALDYRSLKFRRYDGVAGVPLGMEDVEQTAPRGLLEGSAASNPLLTALFNDLPGHLDETVTALVFGDNIAIVAPSDEVCSQAEEDLVRYFADHFAGPFSLTHNRYDARQGFEFLGYAFEREMDGSVAIAHSLSNYVKAMRRLLCETDVLSFRSAERLVDVELLSGFPAVSDDQRDLLIAMASDEIEAVKAGLAGQD